jgi:hypothetical protein
MKKNFVAILAVVIALSLSAYTSSSHKVRKSKATTETPYFWYTLNQSTGKISSTVLNPDAQDVKSNVIEGAPNELTACSNVNFPDCLAGSSSADLQPNDTPDAPTMSRDNRIKKD